LQNTFVIFKPLELTQNIHQTHLKLGKKLPINV